MNARRGFTLIEVLVALLVFAIAAAALGSAYVNVLTAYDTVQRGGQNQEDVRFARSQLLAETDRKKAEEGADFESPGGRHVRWHAEIENTAMPDLFQVSFTCEITDSGLAGTQTTTETFVLLRPTWGDPVDNGKLRQEVRDRITEIRDKLKR